MLREAFDKGKKMVDTFANVILNYSDVEIAVRDATNNEPWGPHCRLMKVIADETFDKTKCTEIMNMLWTRIFPEDSKNWLRISKGLALLTYILRYGSQDVIDNARDHLYSLRSIENYHHLDENGKDVGSNVRVRLSQVLNLLDNEENLIFERKRASSRRSSLSIDHFRNNFNHTNYNGDGREPSTGTSSRQFSNVPNRNRDSIMNTSKPWNSSSKHSDYLNRSKSLQSKDLPSFEEWNVGHERGFTDDITDAFSEVLQVAKIVTSDFFGIPRVAPAKNDENCPQMVSEEIIQPCANASDEVDHPPGHHDTRKHIAPSLPRTSSAVGAFNDHSPPGQNFNSQGRPGVGDLIALKTADDGSSPNANQIPRPPSLECLADNNKPVATSWSINNLTSHIDLIDIELDNKAAKPLHNEPQHLVANTSDDEFGEFTSNFSHTSVPPILPTAGEPKEATPVDLFALSTPKQPTPTIARPQENPKNAKQQVTTGSNSAASSTNITPSLGKTWMDYKSLDLDLDLSIKPKQKSSAMSLQQLRNQQLASGIFF